MASGVATTTSANVHLQGSEYHDTRLVPNLDRLEESFKGFEKLSADSTSQSTRNLTNISGQIEIIVQELEIYESYAAPCAVCSERYKILSGTSNSKLKEINGLVQSRKEDDLRRRPPMTDQDISDQVHREVQSRQSRFPGILTSDLPMNLWQQWVNEKNKARQ